MVLIDNGGNGCLSFPHYTNADPQSFAYGL